MSLAPWRQASPNWRRLTPLLLLLTSGACASILGIEEIQVDPDAGGSAGSGGSSDGVPSGGSNPKGGSSSTTAGKSAGGGDQSGGGAPTAGTGADGPGGSDGSSGAGGSGGAAPATGKVHGHVMDIWGQDVAAVPVQVGDVSVITDTNGEFEVDDVPATYTVSLAISLSNIERYGYVFKGLTRRDPTLQVARAWDFQSGNYVVSALNVTPDVAAGDEVSVGWAGAGISISTTTSAAGRSGTTDWLGPSPTMQGSAQALWLKRDDNGLPSAYYAADSTSFVLGGGNTGTMTFDLTGAAPQSANLQGTVTQSTGVDRVNRLFLRYSSGEVLELVDQSVNAPNIFSFKAPTIPNASLTLAAMEGSSSYSQYAVVHKGGLAANAAVTLTVPTPAQIATPAVGAMVDANTQFSFTPGSHTAKAYVAVITATLDSPYFDKLYIIGKEAQFTIPQVLGENFMHPATEYYWQVTTHGSAQTVDELTGAAGFFDAFGVDETVPSGPRMGDGEYTASEAQLFTTKP